MCDPTGGVATFAVIAATSAALGAHDGAKAKGQMTDNERKQQNEIVKQANWAENDQKLATVDKQDEARRQLAEVNLQALRNQGTINTAIGESGMSGNSMDRLKNSVANDASAEKMNITDNYTRDYQAIFANRVGSSENSKSAVRGQGGNRYKVNNIANALNIVSAGVQGYAAGGGKFGKGTSKTPAGGSSVSVQNGGTR
ncbi:virion core protein, T7 gp14 family [Pseudomonas sp. NPDC089530]|uniref:virion core protein, T7 gp14 family n=1 Tax=Pseudomonas sp. NPDC089530 TaxID=3390651 RepID=UPI003CFFF353